MNCEHLYHDLRWSKSTTFFIWHTIAPFTSGVADVLRLYYFPSGDLTTWCKNIIVLKVDEEQITLRSCFHFLMCTEANPQPVVSKSGSSPGHRGRRTKYNIMSILLKHRCYNICMCFVTIVVTQLSYIKHQ